MDSTLYRFFLLSLVCMLPDLGCATTDGQAPWFGEGPKKAQVVSLQLPATIKVAILHSRKPITISCSGAFSYTAGKNKPISIGKRAALKIRTGKKGLMLGSKPASGTVLIKPTQSDTRLTLNGRPYRGSFIVRSRGKTIVDVIEQISLEDYLYGVLPREVGADWPMESLKAQAVISRTYVLANMGKSNGKGYDVTSDVSSQVYGGLQDETATTNEAVKATKGEVLIDEKGVPVMAFFHSSCGGRTESPQYVWQDIQEPMPYLVGVQDPFCKNDPFYNWRYEISAETLRKRLKRARLNVGTIQEVEIGKTSPSGRAASFIVEWTREKSKKHQRSSFSGNSFRLAVGPEQLRSTLLTTVQKRGKVFRFEGHGWGHGVGLCQWGARGRALEGEMYDQILDSYYPNTRLVKAAAPDQQAKQ